MRILIPALLCLISNAHAAQPSPDYVNSLARVYEGLNQVRHTVAACRALHPELTAGNEAAHARWRQRNQPLLREYEGRYQAWIRQLAAGSAKKNSEYLKIMDGKFRQRQTVRLAQIRTMGKAKSKALCQNYAVQLSTGLDLATTSAADIQLTRRLRPVF